MRNKQIARDLFVPHCDSYFVCSALRFISHEPRKKKTLIPYYTNMLSIQNTSETTLHYIDTQTVSTQNDVSHHLRTQLLILIMQIQERSSGPLMRCEWRIDTDLFVRTLN